VSPEGRVRLVLADDHPIVLDGLVQLFACEPDFQVLARCTTGEDVLAAVRDLAPDVLILDVRMPGMDGLAVLRQMKQEGLPTQVVLLTAALDEEEVLEAIRLGVRGVVLKEMAPRLLVQCVRKVHGGGQWLETRSVARALGRVLHREATMRQLAQALTPREVEVVRRVITGASNKEVAEALCISEGTVKVHLHNIFQKLNVGSRIQLIRHMQERAVT
jgi:DNA-binding NarL/FixJ family response regulator